MSLRYIFGFLSFIIPSILVTNYTLNHYYSGESFLLDTGWFTYLMTQPPLLPLDNPLDGILDKSYFTTHISLFYYPLQILYTLLDELITPQLYFSSIIGSFYGVIGVSIFIAGERWATTTLALTLLSITSIVAPFNGIGLGMIGFPHIEVAIPALTLLFLALYFRGNRYLSYIVVVLLLSVREDAGFHLFGLLSTIILLHYILKRTLESIPKDLIIVTLLSILYSISIIYLQKSLFGGDNALERIYLGEPHFAHITSIFIKDVVEFFINYRSYIYIPMVILVTLAIRSRNIILIVPLLSTLPWLLLSSISITYMPHSLNNYYAFPFMIIPIWIIFSFFIYNRSINYRVLLATLTTTLLSTYLFVGTTGHSDNTPWKKFGFEYLDKMDRVNSAIESINIDRDKFGNILYDEPLSSFMVATLTKEQYGYRNEFFKPQIEDANSIIFFEKNQKILEPIIELKGFSYLYRVKKSDIIVASEFDLAL